MSQRNMKIERKRSVLPPWSTELISKLIDFYRVNRLLWDPTCCDYKSKAKKDQTLALYLDVNGLRNNPLFSVKDVKFKWKILRTTFMENYKKANMKRAGPGKNYVFVPSWQYYEHMSFLKEAIEHQAEFTPTTFNDERMSVYSNEDFIQDIPVDSSCNDDDGEEVLADSQNDDDGFSGSVDYRPPLKKANNFFHKTSSATATVETRNDNIGHYFETVRSSPDNDTPKLEDHFGRYIAAQLQEMNPRSRDLAQFEIVQVLMKYKYPLDG